MRLSLRLLPSLIKQPSVKMKRKAKKKARFDSDSENIQSACFLFDKSNQLRHVRVNFGLVPIYSLNLASDADNGHDWLLLFVLHFVSSNMYCISGNCYGN